jgi:hypothetical protein
MVHGPGPACWHPAAGARDGYPQPGICRHPVSGARVRSARTLAAPIDNLIRTDSGLPELDPTADPNGGSASDYQGPGAVGDPDYGRALRLPGRMFMHPQCWA